MCLHFLLQVSTLDGGKKVVKGEYNSVSIMFFHVPQDSLFSISEHELLSPIEGPPESEGSLPHIKEADKICYL